MKWKFWDTPTKVDPAIELLELLKIVIENQEKTQSQFMVGVNAMAEASAKQAEVLSQYLKLFQSPGEPDRWVYEMEEENKQELAKQGFPAEGSEAEMAEWVLRHMGALEKE